MAIQGNSISRRHGPQAEEIGIVHVLNEDILVCPCLCYIPGQGNGQRLVRLADALLAAGEDQVSACNIGIIYCFCVVDSLCGMQAHVIRFIARLSVDGAHVDDRMNIIAHCLGTSRYEDIAARLHVESACFLRTAFLTIFFFQEDAQRHIACDRKGLHPGGSVFVHRLFYFDIGSAHVQELLHICNGIASGQLLPGNRFRLIGKSAHTLGCI